MNDYDIQIIYNEYKILGPEILKGIAIVLWDIEVYLEAAYLFDKIKEGINSIYP